MENSLLSQHPSELFQHSAILNPDFYPRKKILTKLKPIKRLTPLFLFSFILPALYIYMLKGNIGLLQFVFLLFLEANSLFVNFVLWKYFKDKKIIYQWLIEIPLVLLVLFFFL